jgi:hypothetical protein
MISNLPGRRKLLVAAPIVAASMLQLGCSDEADEADEAERDRDPIPCTAEARVSVVVTVLDIDGSVVDDAVVTYSVDGSASEPCQASPGALYHCGRERLGHFLIAATADGQSATTALTVGRAADQPLCHVGTEDIELTLGP